LFKKIRRQNGIVVANIGDASVGCGPVWEALGLSAMGQFRNLWDEEHRGGPPIIFNFMDNFYGMGGQPIGETMGFDCLARVAAAVNPENMHAETVDGNNPLALADAYVRKIDTIKKEGGPIFLDVLCYRQTGHSPSDQSSYREREEIDLWRQVDPLTEFGQKLVDAGVVTQADIDSIRAYAKRKITKACRLASSLDMSPRLKLAAPGALADFMFSNTLMDKLPGLERLNDVLIPMEQIPRVQNIAKKSRKGIADDGTVLKGAKAVTFGDATFETVVHHFTTTRAS
jgi:2-oxoisovalerate dehydrogenase E1 component